MTATLSEVRDPVHTGICNADEMGFDGDRDLPALRRELTRSTRYISTKTTRFTADDLLQEAMIFGWRERGPLSHRIRAGNWRAASLAFDGRRTFGHPGGQRSGATPPKGAVVHGVLDSDAITLDRYDLPNEGVRRSVSQMSEREQRTVYALAFDYPPGDAATFVGVAPGYFRSLRRKVIDKLRADLTD